MANTRSGAGAQKDGAGDTGAGTSSTRKASAATKAKAPKSAMASTSSASELESRSSARQASDVQEPNLRRSSRETRGKNPNLKGAAGPSTPVSQKSTRGADTPKSSAKKLKGVAELTAKASTPRMSNRVKNSSVSGSTASNDSNGISSLVATPNKTAKRQIDEHDSMKNKHDGSESGSRPLKKQKRLTGRNYAKLFKKCSEVNEISPVSAPKVDEGNISMAHTEDNVSVSVYEESDAQEQDNQARLSQAVNKISKGSTSGLHEAPNMTLETDWNSAPVSEALMPTDLCSEVNVADSSLAMEAKEQTDGYSNESLVPESPNSPNSNIDSNEAKKSIEEDYSIRIQEACALKQTEVTQCDETDCDEHICVVCRSAETPGILKSCDGNVCKRKFHISCLGFPLNVSLLVSGCAVYALKKDSCLVCIQPVGELNLCGMSRRECRTASNIL